MTVLDVPAQLHLEDLVILQHLVCDSGAQVVVLINTLQTELSRILNKAKGDKTECLCLIAFC